jgi:uncharacterized protein with GYD domain
MATFVLLTRLVSEEVKPSFTIGKKEKLVVEKIRKACPKVKWIADYALMGPYDYLDIFEAPDNETAMKVSAIVRQVAGAHTEVWPVSTWKEHARLMRDVAECMDTSIAA